MQIHLLPGDLYATEGDAVAKIEIQDPTSAPKFRVRGLSRGQDGIVHLIIDSVPGLSYVVERSEDLVTWVPVGKFTEPPGLSHLDDPSGTSTP